MRLLALPLILLLMPASAARAQNPSTAENRIAFESNLYENVREGYVTLRWHQFAGAVEYEVIDEQEEPVYRGPLTEAFISGLSDGDYVFRLRAIDDSGSTIATSEPARVMVQHWPLAYAISLFAVGLAVVISVVVVIARGALSQQSPLGTRQSLLETKHV